MPLVRLIAEGVGPFESLDVDFSDGKGNAHLGPHIFAGVNGSGKSTVLRTIAWVLDQDQNGFQHSDWMEMLKGYDRSRALLIVRPTGSDPFVLACSKGKGTAVDTELADWARNVIRNSAFEIRARFSNPTSGFLAPNTTWIRSPDQINYPCSVAAYSPSRALRYIATPDAGVPVNAPDLNRNALAFDSTVDNEAIQRWLLSLYSRRAIARERNQSIEHYDQSLGRFEAALRRMYGQSITFDVEIEPKFQPRLKMMGRTLNFSQLPDGVKSTVGWIADFMMRQDLDGPSPSNGHRPGILLLDEIDAHLHPLWQRRLLPAMLESLPDVQIIVTSHSPFVISSCRGSKVHVLELNAHGTACNRPPVGSPIGESVTTTLKDIFGVDSRFDIQTEEELNEWNELKKREVSGGLSAGQSRQLQELTRVLSERSEELRSIVASPMGPSSAVLESLLRAGNGAAASGSRMKRRAKTHA